MRIFLSLITTITIISIAGTQSTYESVLADGFVYKIKVDQSGIYKIDHALITSLGFNTANASNLAIYGQRGGIVPQSNDDPMQIDDLIEIPSHRIGLEDGEWNISDKVIFYAEGATTWKTLIDGQYRDHNPYEVSNYYYLKVSSDPSIIGQVQVSASDIIFDNYTRYQRFEEDNFNLLDESTSHYPSGQEWYTDIFKNTRQRNYSDKFDYNHLSQGATAKIEAIGAVRSSTSPTIILDVNGQKISHAGTSVSYSSSDNRFADKISVQQEIEVATNQLDINIHFPTNIDSESTYWLDYLQMTGQYEAIYTGNPMLVSHHEMQQYESIGFNISGSEELVAWNITNPHQITELTTSKSANVTTFRDQNNYAYASYMVFDINDVTLIPEAVGQITNQNLHSIERADMVIIYEETFIEQAERLASHRREINGFIVETIDIDQIWNEYSSGKVDPSGLRNFFKMLYQRDPDFRFALLMGDGSFDPRNIKGKTEPGNFIPVYEKKESLEPIYSYPTDDFYALLDPDEGHEGSLALEGDLDIAIGRFPVNTAEQAEAMVSKIIHYETSPTTFGPWRSEIMFVADDGNGTLHISDCNEIARDVKDSNKELHQTKVFFDSYNQISTPGGERYPEATSDIFNGVDQGKLLTCYLGHGGPKGWAQERVLQVEHINNWSNKDNMTVLITATCSFAGYDDPDLVSAGEHTILNPNGGVVALLTTVRSVFTSSNEALTRKTWEALMNSSNLDQTIGEAFAQAKSTFIGESVVRNSRKYTLLGDPAMKLALPRHHIIPKMLNGVDLGSVESDTLLSALERGTITGIIDDVNTDNEEILDVFNGEVFLAIYDKESSIETLVNDDDSGHYEFSAQNTLLFKGRSEVVNGQFSIEFVLPQNIKFDIGKGQLYFYAVDNTLDIDADGQYDQISIGGSLQDDNTDQEGPEIALYMNTYDFKDGGLTHSNPLLIASIFDETGINLSNTSIGHDLKATLDDDDNQSYIVNDYYEGSLEDYRKGEIRYPFRNLEPGLHHVEFTAWDILNNRNTADLTFTVSSGNLEALVNIINYPNPSRRYTNFAFEHDGDGGESLITIHIFDTNGKNVDILQYNRTSEGSSEVDLKWSHGDKNIPDGVYFYHIEMLDLESNTTKTSNLESLIIINN